MKTTCLFLCFLVMLLAGCGDDAGPDGQSEALKLRARVAEVNLTRIRDAVVKYHKQHGEVPGSVTDLKDFGGGESDLEPSEDYSEIGYSFYSVEFDESGKMTQGWFIATPVADSGALQVRMDGVSEELDYVPQGEDFGPAPSTLPPTNAE